jgi:ribosomal protein L40E
MFETVCKRCGTHNDASATFCGSCGAFLEWEGERVSTDADQPVSAEAAIRSPDIPGPSSAPTSPPPTWTAPPPPLFPTSGTSATDAAGTSGVAGAATGSEGTGAGGQPVAMQPALPINLRPSGPAQPRPSTRRTNPGDLICAQCGEGNDPTRRYCRHCGAVLAATPAAVRLSWWRRLLGRRARRQAGTTADPHGASPASAAPPTGAARGARGGPANTDASGAATTRSRPPAPKAPKAPKVPKAPKGVAPAGHRPPAIGTGRGGFGPSRRPGKGWLLVVVVAVVAVFLIVPGLRKHVTSEGTKIRKVVHPDYTEIPVSAVTEAPANGCTLPSIEGNNTVYWYSRATSATSQVLTVTFAPSFTGDLDKIGVTPMAPGSTGAPSAAASPAPSQLRLSGSAPVTPTALSLADPPKFQSFTVKSKAPKSLQIQLASNDPTTSSACAETAFIFYEKD